MAACVDIIDSKMVQAVNAHLSMGVDNVVIFHDDAYVYDAALLIIEKSQVAGLALFNKAKRLTLCGLL